MLFKLSKFFLYVSVFAMAIVSVSTIFPFIVGKYAWFRIAVDLALAFFLMGILANSKQEAGKYVDNIKKVFRSPIGIAVTAFVTVFILAGIFGVNSHMSFWSNFERGEGGLQILHLYAFFLLLAAMFNEEKQWTKIFYCSFATAIIMLAYGVQAGRQIAGFVGPSFDSAGYRLQGTIGNPAYVAVYLIFIIFYALYVLFTQYRHKLLSPGALGIFALLAAFIAGFFAAATRGAMVGLVGAGFIFLVYLVFAGKKFRKTLAALAVAVVLLFGAGIFFKNSADIQKLPFARIFNISITTQTFHDRTVIWKMAWDGFKSRPLLGYGPENFLTVFDMNFNTAYYTPPTQFGAWFDRAHDIVLDYLSETGILGFLAYASMFAAFYYLIFRTRIKTDKDQRIDADETRFSKLPLSARALIFVLPIAYLIQGIVLFDVLPTYINLFMFFAFTYYIFSPEHAAQKKHNEVGESVKYIAVAGIVVSFYAAIWGGVLPYQRAKAYVDVNANAGNIKTVQDFEKQYDNVYGIPSPVGDEEVTKFLIGNIAGIISSQPNQPEEVTRELINYIEPKIDNTDLRHLLPMASIYEVAWQRFHREEDYQKALDYFLKAKEAGPKVPLSLYNLFDLYRLHGDEAAAKDMAKIILQYWPQDSRINPLINGN